MSKRDDTLPSKWESSGKQGKQPDGKGAEYYKAYEEHSKTLRTWLVAYGIGAPVLMLTNERVSKAILSSPHGRLIAALFLMSVILQVALAAVNKTSMWICYYASDDQEVAQSWWCRAAHWISKQFWLDLLIDVGSLAMLSIATWYAFDILVVS